MTIIVRKSDNVITNIGAVIGEENNMPLFEDKNGKYLIGYIQECDTFNDISVSENIIPQKYCYTPEQGFYLNPNYVEYKSPEQQILELKSQLDAVNIALANMMGV